jgi:hypothetical protein
MTFEWCPSMWLRACDAYQYLRYQLEDRDVIVGQVPSWAHAFGERVGVGQRLRKQNWFTKTYAEQPEGVKIPNFDKAYVFYGRP